MLTAFSSWEIVMLAEAMRGAGYAAYRSRLKEPLGIPEGATGNRIHDQVVHDFPASRLITL